ncbi:MAG: serine hydrolase domain-containing protein [Ktedonobacteraceae bacterium]
MRRRHFLASVLALATVPLTASPTLAQSTSLFGTPTLSFTSAPEAGFDPGRLAKAFQFVQKRVSSGLVPGAVLLVARHGCIAGWHAFGQIDRRGGAMRRDAIFDLESISKVVATAPAVMLLVESGVLHLDDPVARYLPNFAAHGKGSITIRDMLRFTSGLDVDAAFQDTSTPRATPAQVAHAWQVQLSQTTVYPTNSQVLYSDLTFRTLGHLIEKVTHMRLDQFVRKHIWEPLRLGSTHYFPNVPSHPLLDRVTGTRYSQLRHRYLRGEMADEQDWWLGGIVGCDSVFSDAYDLAVFNQMMLNGGAYGHTRILQPQTVAAMTRNETPHVLSQRHDYLDGLLYSPKGYGWELSVDPRFNPGGHGFGPAAYGKSGGAGTFMWIDPRRQLMAVYLTNYVEPQPFTQSGWDQLVTDIAPDTLFDLVAAATH